MTSADLQAGNAPRGGLSAGMIVLISVIASVLAVWLTFAWLFPKAFTPVTLSEREQVTLDTKLKGLHLDLQSAPRVAKPRDRVLTPEKYTEEGASRQITFTEREINALIATNTDLADKVAIDLSPGLISAKAIIPLDPDMPLFGGKTLKISAGVELNFRDGRPVVILKGVSFWGVPVPNAWLGDLKNIDLVREYGDAGFWKSFAAGVDNISVGDGTLAVKLKE
ncbi:MAG: arginine N-succinyltransferase [Alphaproteobacteria bacterium]|nr:MAG: arginine N-succinyltransferase [Alphaproteobacteria bacterium]